MDVKVQVYIDRLFRDYEDTPELKDFKEEIAINLQERIKEFKNQSESDEKAFEKAAAELGDITKIADQISRQKRKEVIDQMYVHSRIQVDKKHAVGYAAAGAIALFAIISAFTTYFSTGEISTGVSTLTVFISISTAMFVFLGLTQETNTDFPMEWKRALIYGISSAVIVFGVCVSAMLYFMEGMGLESVSGSLMPFVIPGLCVLVFLLLTEKERHKPWVLERERMFKENYATACGDAKTLEQRGLLSGALWLFSAALFVLLGFIIGFKYSWVVFLFAVACEVLIELWMSSKIKMKNRS
ncbi:permease prefix domain 1-containing protein [Clostridium sp. MT-14]|uniref:permease prefix domain 1-containing protein n=1 Tax=Clostridium sp. MT-14 TaxID=3348360 RepID=UPI0035F26E71